MREPGDIDVGAAVGEPARDVRLAVHVQVDAVAQQRAEAIGQGGGPGRFMRAGVDCGRLRLADWLAVHHTPFKGVQADSLARMLAWPGASAISATCRPSLYSRERHRCHTPLSCTG